MSKKEKSVKDTQLELGKYLFNETIGKDKWEDLDNDRRQLVIKQVIENFQSNIANEDREVEFCYTIDNKDKVQLMAVPKSEYDSIRKSQDSTI